MEGDYSGFAMALSTFVEGHRTDQFGRVISFIRKETEGDEMILTMSLYEPQQGTTHTITVTFVGEEIDFVEAVEDNSWDDLNATHNQVYIGLEHFFERDSDVLVKPAVDDC